MCMCFLSKRVKGGNQKLELPIHGSALLAGATMWGIHRCSFKTDHGDSNPCPHGSESLTTKPIPLVVL